MRAEDMIAINVRPDDSDHRGHESQGKMATLQHLAHNLVMSMVWLTNSEMCE